VAQGSLQANISCGSFTYSEEIQPQLFPLCSDGYGEVFIYNNSCSNNNLVNISVTFSGLTNRRKIINVLELDREYYRHYDNMTYNATAKMWESPHDFGYYVHGSKQIIINCSSSADLNFNNTAVENFTVVNRFPTVHISQVNTSLGSTNLTNEVEIQYANGVWNWIISVVDDDIETVNYTFYNSSGSILYSINKTNAVIVNTSNALFVDFDGNPFNITVIAQDTFKNTTTRSYLFNVTDTTNPTYQGFSNTTVTANTYYTWNANMSDEYLWEFEIMCNNGHNYSVTGLARTSFTFKNRTNITSNTLCNFNITDGHTGELISSIPIEKKPEENKLVFDDIELSFAQDIKDFSYKKEYDRYSFCIEPMEKELHLDILMPEECVKYPSEDYKGWFVCKDEYWIDFEGKYKIDSSHNSVIIDLTEAKENIICFNSIGVLNRVSGSQMLESVSANLYDNPIMEDTNWFNMDALDFTSTSGVLMFFFVFIILVGLIVYSEHTQIPALFVLTGIIWFFFSFLIFSVISALIGIILFAVSIFITFRGMMYL